jgi:hypothetical protein
VQHLNLSQFHNALQQTEEALKYPNRIEDISPGVFSSVLALCLSSLALFFEVFWRMLV